MRIGAMNHPLKDVYEEITFIAENGFEFVDLTYEVPHNSTYDAKKIKQLLIEKKLDVVGHTNPTLPAIYPLDAVREACFDELKHSADFFAEVGARRMNVHPFYYGPHMSIEDKIRYNEKMLRNLYHYCQSVGVELMFENYLTPFDIPEVFTRILSEVPELKIHLDIGHLNIVEVDTPEILEKYFQTFGVEKIVHLHIHDNQGEGDEHLPLGCGNIDWPRIVKILKNFGYTSTATLEVFASDPDYLRLSRDKLKKWWQEA